MTGTSWCPNISALTRTGPLRIRRYAVTWSMKMAAVPALLTGSRAANSERVRDKTRPVVHSDVYKAIASFSAALMSLRYSPGSTAHDHGRRSAHGVQFLAANFDRLIGPE